MASTFLIPASDIFTMSLFCVFIYFSCEQLIKSNKEIKSKIYNIVPEKAITSLQNVVIYELNERNGTITRLGHSLGLPSNEHYLNDLLGETNMLFSNLMEIEDLCEE